MVLILDYKEGSAAAYEVLSQIVNVHVWIDPFIALNASIVVYDNEFTGINVLFLQNSSIVPHLRLFSFALFF